MIYAPPSIIPNGATINGVCHIYQTTKPTTRPNGSALVSGDIWYNFSTGVDGFWNGVYWLDKNIYQAVSVGRSEGYSGNYGIPSNALNNKNGIVVKDAAISFSGVGTHNALNYWTISANIHRESPPTSSAITVNTIGKVFGASLQQVYFLETIALNTYYAGNQFTIFMMNFVMTGAPGLLTSSITVNYWVAL